MTQEKLSLLLIILILLGGAAYFGSTMLSKKDETNLKTTQDLIFNTPLPAPNPESSELKFSKNKNVGSFPGVLKPEILTNKKAVIQTDKGKIEFEIYPEASMAASNFILLSANGFYDNLTFHRVEPGFVIQGGDPLGNGSGGPGYQFEDEKVTRKYDKGIVAMANSGPNTNGSQFFIMLDDHPELPPKYTIFGKIVLGIEVVEKIVPGDIMKKVTIQLLK